MGSEVVSLKAVVANANQIKVTLRDNNGQSIEEFSARRTAAEPKPSDPRPTAAPTNPVPAPSKETCDEVSCALNNYEGLCCAKFKKAGPSDRSAGKVDVPDSLDRAMISEGIAEAKARVMSCDGKSVAKGIVKVSVEVSPNGDVTSVTVKQTPDESLGDCVAGEMKKATFAKTLTGGSFAYPFTF